MNEKIVFAGGVGDDDRVDFELNDEQRLFRQTLREFADKEITPVAPEWERTGRYPTEIVDRLRELGLFGLNVPEEYGGLDADRVSYALAFEEIARAWLGCRPWPAASSGLASR
jgi:alkylation response protein AidB-like acyl-CoA dehydrogenase